MVPHACYHRHHLLIYLPTMNKKPRLLCGAAAILLLTILPSGCHKKPDVSRPLTAAMDYFAKGEYPAAEIEFKNVLSLKPGHPEALKGLGLCLVRQGAMFNGGHVLVAAKSQLPTDDEVGVNLALALFDLGFIADSRKELMTVLDRTPANGEALILLAESSFTPAAMTECEDHITRANASDQPPVMLAAATLELRRGNLEASSRTLERIVQSAPEFSRALALQGNLLRFQKHPEDALTALKKASDLAGPRSTERGHYAKLLVALGRQDDAVNLLKEATRKAPDYLPNWRMLARLAFNAGDNAAAAENLSKVLAKCPLDPEAALLQSQLWLLSKEPAKAVKLLEDLTKNFPARPQFELTLGKAYLAVDDCPKAETTLDRVLTLLPGDAEAILLRSALHLKDGQPADAIRLTQALLTSHPNNGMAQDLLVSAYCAANRLDEAIELLRQQVAASPKEPNPQLRLGQLLRTKGKNTEARATFEQILLVSPDQFVALAQLVALDEQDGNREQALARVNTYLSKHPESSQACLFKAQLCYAHKDFKTAETAAQKAIELKPDDTLGYLLLVRAQNADGRPQQAVQRIQELLRSSPNNLALRMCLGALLEETGKPAEARACYEEMLKLSPDFAPACNNLACILATIPGNLDKALENARKARSLAPDDPSISDTNGWILWLRGDYRRALPFLTEAANGLPESAPVIYHLAMAHYMMLHTQEAIAAFETALAIPGDFPEKDQAASHFAILRDADHLDLPTLENQFKQYPKDVVLMVLIAKKLTAAGRPQDAATAYHNALAVNPDLEAPLLALAELYTTALNQPDKAIETANQARKLAPQDPHTAAVLGAAYFRLGKHDEAFAMLDEAARTLPLESGVQHDCAWAAYSTGRVAQARAIMAKLATGDPAMAADAKDFLALTDPDAPADATTPALVEKKLAADPAWVPALMARAALQQQAGQDPVAGYVKVLDTFPRFDPARIALARIYLDYPAKLDAAEKLATDARQRLTNDPDLSGILAIIGFRKKHFDDAAQLLTELSAQRPLTGSELFALGMSQAATQHPAQARQSLAKALLTKLPQPDADMAKSTLADLDKPSDNHRN